MDGWTKFFVWVGVSVQVGVRVGSGVTRLQPDRLMKLIASSSAPEIIKIARRIGFFVCI